MAVMGLILAGEGTFGAGIRYTCKRRVPVELWDGGFALKSSPSWLDLISILLHLHINTFIISSQTGNNITRKTFAPAPLWNVICDNELCVCQTTSLYNWVSVWEISQNVKLLGGQTSLRKSKPGTNQSSGNSSWKCETGSLLFVDSRILEKNN